MTGRGRSKKEDIISMLRGVGADVEEGEDSIILKFDNVTNVRHMTPSAWVNNKNLDAVVVEKKNDGKADRIYVMEEADGSVSIKRGDQMDFVAELPGYIRSVETNTEIDTAYVVIGKGRPRRKKA